MINDFMKHGYGVIHNFDNTYQIAWLQILFYWKDIYIICVIEHRQCATGPYVYFTGVRTRYAVLWASEVVSLVIYRVLRKFEDILLLCTISFI